MTESRRILFSRLFLLLGGSSLVVLMLWIASERSRMIGFDRQLIYIPFLASTVALTLSAILSRRTAAAAVGARPLSLTAFGASVLLILIGVSSVVWWNADAAMAAHQSLLTDFTLRLHLLNSQDADLRREEKRRLDAAKTAAESQGIQAEIRERLGKIWRAKLDLSKTYTEARDRIQKRSQLW